jgi:hypothetical protein
MMQEFLKGYSIHSQDVEAIIEPTTECWDEDKEVHEKGGQSGATPGG